MVQVPPPRWSTVELAQGAEKSIANFKDERITEPLEIYSDRFDKYRDFVESLLEESLDLTRLVDVVDEYITNNEKRYALRYLASPAVSDDDLKVLADTRLSARALHDDPGAAGRIVDVILAGLDRWRFPWVSEGRGPTAEERLVATISTTSLIAASRSQTFRRITSKKDQEEQIAAALRDVGFVEVPTREIGTIREAPLPGQYCHESLLGGSKADIVVGMWDNRILAIEAKVSNSYTNSVKRVNREAAAKATAWITKFGNRGIVPSAVLSGVYKVHNLVSAQDAGLTIFWAHDLGTMLEFVDRTR